MDMADRMAEDGWLDAGYNQVNVDDCYLAMQRDNVTGDLVGDPVRFPDGLKALGDYIHKRGLKYGVYEDFGTETCGGYPGVLGHIEQDANTFAAWGADMLKLDGCNCNITDMPQGYPNMSLALAATGRPIVYSCSWPAYYVAAGVAPNYTDIAQWCNLWRLYTDVDDSWDSVQSIIDYWGDNQDVLIPAAGPGAWNDMDQLIIGDFGLSYEQSKTQMAFWCLLASPLLMSVDLRAISDEAREILMNKEVIAINQDPMGRQGRRYYKGGDFEIWARPLENGDFSVILFNPQNCCPQNSTFNFSFVGIPSNTVVIRDVFTHEYLGVYKNNFTAEVNPNGVLMMRITPMSDSEMQEWQLSFPSQPAELESSVPKPDLNTNTNVNMAFN